MAICEACTKQHEGGYGSGRFCGQKCARSFATAGKRDEIGAKISARLRQNPQRWVHNPEGRKPWLRLERQRFGHLVVLDRLPSVRKTRNRSAWRCQCDCGMEVKVLSDLLQRGGATTCGRKGCLFHKPLRYADPTQSSFNELLRRYRHQARTRGLSFGLTPDEFRGLTQKECFYCGDLPSMIAKVSNVKGKTSGFIYNGIDRTDNNEGYSLDNCVSACGVCNRMKMAMGKDEFLRWVAKIYARHSCT